jgi:hypothetical protein
MKSDLAPSPSSVLAACSSSLAALRDIIIGHEETFAATTLRFRLLIGLQCLQAYQVFVIPDNKRKGVGGRPKNSVTHDAVFTPGGFEGWLCAEVSWLKKPTAYKYMEAVHGLGLDHTATGEAVEGALETLTASAGPQTLKSLIDRSPARIAAPQPQPEPQQTEFEFIRSNLAAFRVESENIIALAGQLRLIPDAHRAACARAYGLLTALTGTDWSPSDQPDALATIDPDTLTL